MKKPRLGQVITVSKRLERKHIRRNIIDNSHKPFINRRWEGRDIKPIECVVIGIRTISNGYQEYDGEQFIYTAMEHIKAIVVVDSLYSKPFNVPYSEFIESIIQ
jgi:hypothetical protein